jgi:hypothetical protein
VSLTTSVRRKISPPTLRLRRASPAALGFRRANPAKASVVTPADCIRRSPPVADEDNLHTKIEEQGEARLRLSFGGRRRRERDSNPSFSPLNIN